jgi:AraC-like DNA-binding protein
MVTYTKYSDIEIFRGEIDKHQYPWHFHDGVTIIKVKKGSITYEFQDREITVTEGEILIIEPFQVHRNKISQLTIYKAIFVPNEYFEFGKKIEIMTQVVKHLAVIEGMDELFQKIETNSQKKELIKHISGLCEKIKKYPAKPEEVTSIKKGKIAKIDHDRSIKELAKEAQLSKFHYQRKFKKNHGLTIGQWKQQDKTMKAKMLLESGKLSIDIAYDLGFFDQSHFIKYFKKMWAITPKNFK